MAQIFQAPPREFLTDDFVVPVMSGINGKTYDEYF